MRGMDKKPHCRDSMSWINVQLKAAEKWVSWIFTKCFAVFKICIYIFACGRCDFKRVVFVCVCVEHFVWLEGCGKLYACCTFLHFMYFSFSYFTVRLIYWSILYLTKLFILEKIDWKHSRQTVHNTTRCFWRWWFLHPTPLQEKKIKATFIASLRGR